VPAGGADDGRRALRVERSPRIAGLAGKQSRDSGAERNDAPTRGLVSGTPERFLGLESVAAGNEYMNRRDPIAARRHPIGSPVFRSRDRRTY
jgi:hypothetical protein